MEKTRSISIKHDSASEFMAGLKEIGGTFSAPVDAMGTHVLDETALTNFYRSSWVIRKVCDQYAQDMTSQGVEWLIDSKRADYLEKQFRELGIWRQLETAIKWSRLYGGALAMLDFETNDANAVVNFAAPFRGLRVFTRYETTPDTSKLIPSGRHSGEPQTYDIAPALTSERFKVDASRVIRFTGSALPPRIAQSQELWGDSVVQAMADVAQLYNKSTEGVGELMKRCYLRQIGIKGYWNSMTDCVGSPDSPTTQNILEGMELINKAQSISGLTVTDAEDTFSTQQYSFGGIKDVLDQFGQQLAGAADMPLVVIFGMSPAGFSTGDADLANYARSVLSKQESMLREPIALIAKSILCSSGFNAEDIDFRFSPLIQPSLQERASAAQVAVSTILQVHDAGLIAPEKALTEIRRLSETTGLFASITDADVEYVKAPAIPEPDLGEPDGAVQSSENVPAAGTSIV